MAGDSLAFKASNRELSVSKERITLMKGSVFPLLDSIREPLETPHHRISRSLGLGAATFIVEVLDKNEGEPGVVAIKKYASKGRRDAEASALEIAREIWAGPKIFYKDEEESVLIREFIIGKPLEPWSSSFQALSDVAYLYGCFQALFLDQLALKLPKKDYTTDGLLEVASILEPLPQLRREGAKFWPAIEKCAAALERRFHIPTAEIGSNTIIMEPSGASAIPRIISLEVQWAAADVFQLAGFADHYGRHLENFSRRRLLDFWAASINRKKDHILKVDDETESAFSHAAFLNALSGAASTMKLMSLLEQSTWIPENGREKKRAELLKDLEIMFRRTSDFASEFQLGLVQPIADIAGALCAQQE